MSRFSIRDSTADKIIEITNDHYILNDEDDKKRCKEDGDRYFHWVLERIVHYATNCTNYDLVIDEYCNSYFCYSDEEMDRLMKILCCIYKHRISLTKRYCVDKGEMYRISIWHDKDRTQIFSFQYSEPN